MNEIKMNEIKPVLEFKGKSKNSSFYISIAGSLINCRTMDDWTLAEYFEFTELAKLNEKITVKMHSKYNDKDDKELTTRLTIDEQELIEKYINYIVSISIGETNCQRLNPGEKYQLVNRIMNPDFESRKKKPEIKLI